MLWHLDFNPRTIQFSSNWCYTLMNYSQQLEVSQSCRVCCTSQNVPVCGNRSGFLVGLRVSIVFDSLGAVLA